MASHQTVTLERGAHESPDKGVCVMELASMLAGEPFSDRPQSVSPLLRNLLRTYNDLVDDERRQDLYGYASLVVGTHANESNERVEGRRRRLCLRWARERATRKRVSDRIAPGGTAGVRAATCAAARGSVGHEEFLSLVEELMAMGSIEAEMPRITAAPTDNRTTTQVWG